MSLDVGLSLSAAIGSVYFQLDRVLLLIVNQLNDVALSLYAINRNTRLAMPNRPLHDSDVIYRLTISVMHLELFPIVGKARSKVQFVHVQSQP